VDGLTVHGRRPTGAPTSAGRAFQGRLPVKGRDLDFSSSSSFAGTSESRARRSFVA
jgi:hypothetical protein